ncbi:MerR family transcriptional regulator [Faecalispora anaeroviscerum]|uniref:MerR family transcriptional regulator n=1 Tax=Faecalispora anaeroviscerum TaxID=2991836 RepID=UPI0024BA8A61|nr:MerR family transcriptional regulator [Faecalispora anaeroviscerum]
MLKIGDFSKLSRISIRMLRHYDEIGLLVPESIDSVTSYRHYSEAQLLVANQILALREMGFSLSVTAEILKTYHDPQAFRQYLLLKRAEMLEQEEKIGRQLLLLETAITRLGKDENMMEYTVILKELPERTVASLRKVIPAYDQEGILWEQLQRELGPQNVQFANPCNATAVFYDEGYKEIDPDVEIQLSVQGSYRNTENVVFKTLPAIQIASATYQGSYEQINDVNRAVANWVKDNRYEFNGAMFNIYHVSPAQTQNPDELVTEVCFPVKKK